MPPDDPIPPVSPLADMIRVSDGLDVLALRTPTLPPATKTNTSLLGRQQVWVVDPATPYDDERSRLLAAVDAVAASEGRVLAGIVLTHHHRDHVGAAAWLREHRGLAVWGHAQTAALLGSDVVDHVLTEGDTLHGSQADDDAWTVLHTPGHASGHIVLWEPRRRLMIAGDMVAAEGTIVVDPPDGHMTTYIAQLRRLRALEPRVAVPAHGPPITTPCDTLDYYVRHRLEREGKVLAAARSDGDDRRGRSLMDITARAYTDVPKSIHPLAARAALAHLVKLEEDAAVVRTGADAVAPAALTLQQALGEGILWTAPPASG